MSGILQVLPAFHVGGVEQSVLTIANHLSEQGIPSFVASSGGMLQQKLLANVTHLTLPLRTKNPFKIIHNAVKLRRLIAQYDIKIIHAGSRAPAWSAYLAAKLSKIAFVTTYHGAYSQNFFKWYYNRVMALGTPVIVASNYMAEHVKKYYPTITCTNIPCGINPDFFTNDATIKEQSKLLRSKWHLKRDDKAVILVARFTRIKGHAFLLESLANCKQKKVPSVVFVGDSQNLNLIHALKQKAALLKIKLFVHLDEPDLRPFYDAADVVVVPTTKPESFGLVTAEAMSMGKVVIGNNLGASPELINDPTWIFDATSQASLACNIAHALALAPKQAQAIGQKNRERVVALYNTKNFLAEHMRIYNDLLKAAR